MVKVFLDDLRKFSDSELGYNSFRDYEECISFSRIIFNGVFFSKNVFYLIIY